MSEKLQDQKGDEKISILTWTKFCHEAGIKVQFSTRKLCPHRIRITDPNNERVAAVQVVTTDKSLLGRITKYSIVEQYRIAITLLNCCEENDGQFSVSFDEESEKFIHATIVRSDETENDHIIHLS